MKWLVGILAPVFLASVAMADTASYSLFGCLYEKPANAENWTHLFFTEGHYAPTEAYASDIWMPFTIGPKGAAFAAVCSGIVPDGHGAPNLFIQLARGKNLAFAGAPTCLVTGDSVTAETKLQALVPPEGHISIRKTFDAPIAMELFYVLGIKPALGKDPERCEKIFNTEVLGR
jgi:hypothetical protein